MLQDPLAGLEAEVQAAELRVALLELVHDPQRLQVVLEAAVFAHAVVQHVLARVAEGRVPEVVREADRLGQRLGQRTARPRPSVRSARPRASA